MSVFSFFRGLFPVHQQPVQQIIQTQVLPLPCPTHGCVLVPEQTGQTGEYHFYCPVCRLAVQHVEKPVQQVCFPRRGKVLPGSIMHTQRAVKRVSQRLGQPIKWNPPARPGKAAEVERKPIFASMPTVMDVAVILNKDAS